MRQARCGMWAAAVAAALVLAMGGCQERRESVGGNGQPATQQETTQAERAPTPESPQAGQTQQTSQETQVAQAPQEQPKAAGNPVVVMETSEGTIRIELYPDKAPITVANFLQYVDAKFYDGTIFHRVIPTFMVQGGGFTPDMQQKATLAQIKNEAANGLKNDRGTIAMARTRVVDSATAQFFINVTNNDFLNYRAPTPDAFGYCVFGTVTEGMDVVDRIKTVRTGYVRGMEDVPLTPVVIKSVRRAE